MNKNDLLFYNEYEEFYNMAESSVAFRSYCEDAFGKDFSQDGFSNFYGYHIFCKGYESFCSAS